MHAVLCVSASAVSQAAPRPGRPGSASKDGPIDREPDAQHRYTATHISRPVKSCPGLDSTIAAPCVCFLKEGKLPLTDLPIQLVTSTNPHTYASIEVLCQSPQALHVGHLLGFIAAIVVFS